MPNDRYYLEKLLEVVPIECRDQFIDDLNQFIELNAIAGVIYDDAYEQAMTDALNSAEFLDRLSDDIDDYRREVLDCVEWIDVDDYDDIKDYRDDVIRAVRNT